ncbi:hypothetical protein IAU60_000525 [Kwoniella sp. DSM 27419]
MPLHTRRPDLPSLLMPSYRSSRKVAEDVHTPLTPSASSVNLIPFQQGAMVMTPDTPSFDLPPFDLSLGGKGPKAISSGIHPGEDLEWTEDEDGLLQSYLAHPPRALRHSYPPGTLPPPGALDEITTQLITTEMRRSPPAAHARSSTFFLGSSNDSDSDNTPIGFPSAWRHSWDATRQRLFTVARKESMESTGGHRRKISDSIIPSLAQLPVEDVKMRASRPRLAVLGGQSMNRQQHSMDSLYGDEQPQEISETLRLSSTLQVNAQGANSILTAGSGLSSPLAFSFNLDNQASGRKPFPFSAPTSYLPRPSLLQRGRSFTSDDFIREHAKSASLTDDDDLSICDVDAECRPRSPPRISVRPDMQRSVSSPASTLNSSPPSSISSRSEMDLECERADSQPTLLDIHMDVEDREPITPVKQTFSHLGLGLGGPLGSQCSTPTVTATPLNPPPIAQPPSAAPAITLTVNSPERPGPSRSRGGTSPSEAFAALSLDAGRMPLAQPVGPSPAGHCDGVHGPTAGIKRALKPVSLHRSLSEGNTMPLGGRNVVAGAGARAFKGLTMTSLSGERDRETKRQRSAGMRLGPAAGLTVVVPPRRAGMPSDELRSPFEIKRAL